MGLRWAQKNISPVGIDFGADSIKLLQVLSEDPPRLVAAAERDIPLDVRKQSEAYYRFVAEALREMVRDAGVRTRRVVASISAAQTYVQHVRVPTADPEMIEQQIEMGLRGRLPLDPLNMVVRHVDVGQVFADGAAKQEVICLAASREVVMRSVKAIRGAGLDVVGMHCEPMAILAAFAHLFRRAGDEKRTTFFIDIGGATTKALIAHGKQLVFAKTIHVAGEHFNRQMAQAWQVDVTEARLRRMHATAQATAGEAETNQTTSDEQTEPTASTRERRQNATPPGMEAIDTDAPAEAPAAEASAGAFASSVAASAPPPAPAASAVAADPQPGLHEGESEMLEALVDELQLCAGYHASMFPDRPIEKVVFLGGESRHVHLCQRIARALRLPAQLADPMARLVKSTAVQRPDVDLQQPQPGWAVPVGLCTLPTNL